MLFLPLAILIVQWNMYEWFYYNNKCIKCEGWNNIKMKKWNVRLWKLILKIYKHKIPNQKRNGKQIFAHLKFISLLGKQNNFQAHLLCTTLFALKQWNFHVVYMAAWEHTLNAWQWNFNCLLIIITLWHEKRDTVTRQKYWSRDIRNICSKEKF